MSIRAFATSHCKPAVSAAALAGLASMPKWSRRKTAAITIFVTAAFAVGPGLSPAVNQAEAKSRESRAPTTGMAKATPNPSVRQTGVKGMTTGKYSKECVKYRPGCPRAPHHQH